MHVAVRSDGGPTLGFGHLVRTGRLADEMLDRGHDVTYLTRTPDSVRQVCPDAVRVDALAEGGVDEVAERLVSMGAEALVVDAGDVSLDEQHRLSDAVEPFVLVLDDDGGTVRCDALVNGHVYVSPADYDWVGDEPRWFVGGDYVVFDRALREYARRDPPWRDPPERALVTMGGSDVRNTTPDAMRAFDGLDVTVDVVVGPGFENVADVEAARDDTDCAFRLVENPDDMAERLFRADFAVTALGLTAYELLAVRTPFVGVLHAADQRPKAAALRERDVALVLDGDADAAAIRGAVTRLADDAALRRNLRRRAGEVVSDGTAAICDGIEALA